MTAQRRHVHWQTWHQAPWVAGQRFHQEHQPVARAAAVDDRRRIFRLRADIVDHCAVSPAAQPSQAKCTVLARPVARDLASGTKKRSFTLLSGNRLTTGWFAAAHSPSGRTRPAPRAGTVVRLPAASSLLWHPPALPAAPQPVPSPASICAAWALASLSAASRWPAVLAALATATSTCCCATLAGIGALRGTIARQVVAPRCPPALPLRRARRAIAPAVPARSPPAPVRRRAMPRLGRARARNWAASTANSRLAGGHAVAARNGHRCDECQRSVRQDTSPRPRCSRTARFHPAAVAPRHASPDNQRRRSTARRR